MKMIELHYRNSGKSFIINIDYIRYVEESKDGGSLLVNGVGNTAYVKESYDEIKKLLLSPMVIEMKNKQDEIIDELKNKKDFFVKLPIVDSDGMGNIIPV